MTTRAGGAALQWQAVPDVIATPDSTAPTGPLPDNVIMAKDHFVCRDGVTFAGTHLLLDFYDAEQLDQMALMESAMREAVDAAGATLLHIHLHHFTPQGGISGVAVLSESHISVHTWPERGYAAFDIFMCGDARPELAAQYLEQVFRPRRAQVQTHRRGVI